VEIDTAGDAFFVAFSRPSDALAAAADAQDALALLGVPVRTGVHTGEVVLGETGYVGMEVHRAARICSAGHGGQVLISQATRELVEDDLPDGIALRDLGE
jgi:class 3 adenylate cyclase